MQRTGRPDRLLVIVVALALGLGGGVARAAMHGGGGSHGGGFHGRGGGHGGGWGGHGHGHGPHVFIDGGFFFGSPYYWGYDPFFYGGPGYYPYPPAYAYPYPYYYPPEEPETEPPPPPEEQEQGGASQPQAPGEGSRASYGLVQLRSVPDGASVDLDGRFWLTAKQLDARWLGLPEGPHTITVRKRNTAPATRQVAVDAGTTRAIDFGPGH